MNQLLEFGLLCVLVLNVGTAWQRARIVSLKGFNPIEGFIMRYDAVLGWVCAVATYIMYIGSKL